MYSEAVNQGEKAIDDAMLDRAIETHDVSLAEHAVYAGIGAMTASMSAGYLDSMLWTIGAIENAPAVRLARVSTRRGAPRVRTSLSIVNPDAVKWAKERSSYLITEVSRDTKASVRRIIQAAVDGRLSLADAKAKIKLLVGLRSDQIAAIENLEARILDNPGGKVWAGKVPIRVPENGFTRAELQRRLNQYKQRLLNQRADMIARTETIASANEGQRLAWIKAKKDGDLVGDQVRVWITAPLSFGPCDVCLPMNGRYAEIDGAFEGPDGPITIPAHPNCRCGQGLVPRPAPGTKGAPDSSPEPREASAIRSESIVSRALSFALRLFGGKGSGNFGHKGRPGKRGGSSGRSRAFEPIYATVDPGSWNQDQLDEYIRSRSASKLSNENGDEKTWNSLVDYTGSGYRSLNRFLRRGESFESAADRDAPKRAAVLDEVFRDSRYVHPFEEHTAVYRGIPHAERFPLTVGAEFEDKGFTSVSLDPRTARDFTSSAGGVMRITVPKGSKYVVPDDVWESEILLNRGGKYRVTDHHFAPDGRHVWQVQKIG